MKRWFCCAVASCCAGILPAEESRWVNDSVGNDVTGCYLWGDKANWQDERPPTGSPTDTVSFTNCVGGERYISMPAEVETGKIYFSDDSRTVLIGGSLLSGGIRAKSTTANVASRVYADILVSEEGTTLGTVEICGDMRLSAGNRLIYSSVDEKSVRIAGSRSSFFMGVTPEAAGYRPVDDCARQIAPMVSSFDYVKNFMYGTAAR